MNSRGVALVGCAGWNVPHDLKDEFGPGTSHLHRYATRFGCVEINSSFYRPHLPQTYARWAASVPADFRFCVKLPRAVTHERRLADCEDLLDAFFAQVSGLGTKLACALVQLPPSLAFDAKVSATFFASVHARWKGSIALEPRHATWFAPSIDTMLAEHRIARVLADPVRLPDGEQPGGSRSFTYLRLHGSPRMYYSSYDRAILQALASRIEHELHAGRDVWCIFDNTASGAAAHNALALSTALHRDLE